jgi:hypothetical protein
MADAAETPVATGAKPEAETYQFQAEINQLMSLISK